MVAIDVSSKDPFVNPTKEFFQNPYPFLEQIRSEGDLVWSSSGEPRWIVSSYDLCSKIFADQRFSVEVPESQLEQFHDLRHSMAYNNLIVGLTKFMLAQDPPRHTRVRKLANKAFTRAEIGEMSGRIEAIIDSLIDKFIAKGQVELISEFAFPLPITVICEFLGLPASDHQMLRDWSDPIAKATEPVVLKADLAAAAKAADGLFSYLKDLIEVKKKKPDSGLLSALIQAEDQGDHLDQDELLANMLLLIIAGHETTVNLIASSMLCFIQNPGTIEQMSSNSILIPMALEEVLRFESPIQSADRYVLEDMEFGGQSLKKEQRLSVLIGAANRDPQHFDSPNTFNVDRQPKHLAFGNAIHFCLGAPLARFEAKLAFERLFARMKNIKLDIDVPQYRESASFRSLASLPLRFEAK